METRIKCFPIQTFIYLLSLDEHMLGELEITGQLLLYQFTTGCVCQQLFTLILSLMFELGNYHKKVLIRNR